MVALWRKGMVLVVSPVEEGNGTVEEIGHDINIEISR